MRLQNCNLSKLEVQKNSTPDPFEPLFEPKLAFLVGLQVMSSKEGGGRREEGGRENFLTSFLVATAKSSSMIVGLGGKISYINVRV